MVTISLEPCNGGSWSVCRSNIRLFRDVPLELAIKLARELAQDEHARSGRNICVEIPGELAAVVLARYAKRSAQDFCGAPVG